MLVNNTFTMKKIVEQHDEASPNVVLLVETRKWKAGWSQSTILANQVVVFQNYMCIIISLSAAI
jgi:hypothetical protein